MDGFFATDRYAWKSTRRDFADDFEDGQLHPAYQFRVGDPSLVNEESGVLSTSDSINLFLPSIPGIPFPLAPTEITPGVNLSIDVLQYRQDVIVELGIADSGDNPLDYFVLSIEGAPTGLESSASCYDEEQRIWLDGVMLSPPVMLTIWWAEGGLVTGSFTDSSGTIDCPLLSANSDSSLAAHIVLWAGWEEGYAEVDNFWIALEDS